MQRKLLKKPLPDCVYVQSWPAFRHWALFDTWRRRFRTRLITPPHPFMDASKHYLYAQFPHATFPMACVLNPPLIGQPGTGAPCFQPCPVTCSR
jgi:hypothetical protein